MLQVIVYPKFVMLVLVSHADLAYTFLKIIIICS